MSDWQTIETAPRDGSEVIGCIFHKNGNGINTHAGPWTMSYDGTTWVPSWDEFPVLEYEDTRSREYKTLGGLPTHWMPLPQPPE